MNRKLFFPYLLAGYPDSTRFVEVLELTTVYADTIEIGIPFSDPIADGPVLARASHQVLSKGVQIEFVFSTLLRIKNRVPLAIMSYANPILALSRSEFFTACKQSGVRSVIVPDVPHEESEDWRAAANESGLQWISFISLQTGEARLKKIAAEAEGFLYLLSLTGTTGAKMSTPEIITAKATAIRRHTNVPLALGFGIKSAEDIRPFMESVDAFIVGSRIIELIQSNNIHLLEKFYRGFTNACKTGIALEKEYDSRS